MTMGWDLGVPGSAYRAAAAAVMAVSLGACTGGAADFASLGSASRLGDLGAFPATGHMVASSAGATLPAALLRQRMQARSIGASRGALVPYKGAEEPGTIVIAQSRQTLYFVEPDGKAIRYAVAVGAAQTQWTGVSSVTAVHLQPGWTAPESLRRGNTGPAPVYPSGSPDNPMGIGALTLSGGDYAIHGTNRPDSIGRAVSGGCFRMFNEDIADLMRRVRVGTRVVVQS